MSSPFRSELKKCQSYHMPYFPFKRNGSGYLQMRKSGWKNERGWERPNLSVRLNAGEFNSNSIRAKRCKVCALGLVNSTAASQVLISLPALRKRMCPAPLPAPSINPHHTDPSLHTTRNNMSIALFRLGRNRSCKSEPNPFPYCFPSVLYSKAATQEGE